MIKTLQAKIIKSARNFAKILKKSEIAKVKNKFSFLKILNEIKGMKTISKNGKNEKKFFKSTVWLYVKNPPKIKNEMALEENIMMTNH